MPPKGWRKTGESQAPNATSNTDTTSIDDLLFPRSTVHKLAKQILNEENGDDNMIIAKDSLLALQRSATVFVSHMLYYARQVSKDSARKTVNSQDILMALERAELSGFVPHVKQNLAQYELQVAHKKKMKLQNAAEGKETAAKEGTEGTETSQNGGETSVETGASGPAQDEPVSKKLKASNGAIAVRGDDNEDENEEANEEDEVNENDEVVEAEEEVEEDDEVEQIPQNPIEALGNEEKELAGEEPVEVQESDNESD